VLIYEIICCYRSHFYMTHKDQFLSFVEAQADKSYAPGAEGPDSFDCSGLVYAGISQLTPEDIPRLSTDQYELGIWVSLADVKSGDLIFFDTEWTERKPNHNGVVVNQNMLNANSFHGKVVEESFLNGYWCDRVWGARRIFDGNGSLNLSGGSGVFAPEFADVPLFHPDYDYILELRKKGVIEGFSGNLFQPSLHVSRAEALKIILLSFQIPIEETLHSSFSDVSDDAWFLHVVEPQKIAAL